MGSETSFAHTFADSLRPFGKVQLIESPQESGIGDACCCLRRPVSMQVHAPAVTSWVEFKHEHRWPVRITSPVKLKRFTKQQLLFLEGWDRIGGKSYLMLQIAADYLLFSGGNLRPLFNGARRPDVEASAILVVRGANTFPTARVLKCLTR